MIPPNSDRISCFVLPFSENNWKRSQKEANPSLTKEEDDHCCRQRSQYPKNLINIIYIVVLVFVENRKRHKQAFQLQLSMNINDMDYCLVLVNPVMNNLMHTTEHMV